MQIEPYVQSRLIMQNLMYLIYSIYKKLFIHIQLHIEINKKIMFKNKKLIGIIIQSCNRNWLPL